MADETEVKDTVSSISQSPEWILRKQVEAELRATLRPEYELLFKLWKESDLADLEKKNNQFIQENLEKLYEKYKDSLKPPTHEELQQLLAQEYETFTFKVEHGKVNRHFTLVELPSNTERKFYDMFKNKLMNKTAEIQALTQAGMDMPFETKLKSVLTMFDDTFDALAETVVLCLNPYNDDKEIDKDWVQNNISLNRQWSVVEAQIGVNKLKDFFSRVYQSGQSMQTMMTGVNFQQLQRLVR